MKNGEHEVSPSSRQGMNLLCFYRHFFVGVISFVGMGCYALYFFFLNIFSSYQVLLSFLLFFLFTPTPLPEKRNIWVRYMYLIHA